MYRMTGAWADYDVYWHLQNGRVMVEQGRFPSPDTFSWSARGAEYVAYSAQVDRLLYLLWKLGGVRALGIFAAAGYALTLLPAALLIGRLRARPWLEALAMGLVVFAVAPYMGARPHVIAFALLGFISLFLDRPFGLRKALTVGVLLGVWANLHGTFYFGFAAVGAAAAAWLPARDGRSLASVAGAALAGFALSLLSPYGAGLWAKPLDTASSAYLAYNEDWLSLKPLTSTDAAMGVLLVSSLAVGVWRACDARALAAFGLVLPAIQVSRFTPFAAPLLASLTLERLLDRYPRLRSAEAEPPQAARWIALTVLAGGALVVAAMLPTTFREASYRPLPTASLDALLRCGAPAPVWNDYNWGGLLLWRGGGAYAVGVDGRAETLYSEELLGDYYTVYRRSEGWREVVLASPAQYAFVEKDLAREFAALPRWRLVASDAVGGLAVREDAVWRCR